MDVRNASFRILGPVAAAVDGVPVALGPTKQRALLAFLLLRANRVVARDQLMEALWGERPPETATTALHGYVSGLRKALGAERIETRAPGYLLRTAPGEVDVERFERLLADSRTADGSRRAEQLHEALDLWRGEPLGDLESVPFVADERRRLDELRLAALEERIDADLELGRHGELVPELEALVRRNPLRERLRGQLMLALYRSGRQADALEAYRDGRRLLDEELGLEPGEELKRLERAILEQDAAIGGPAPPRAPARPSPAGPGRPRRLLIGVGALLVAAAAAAVAASWSTSRAGGRPADDDHVIALDGTSGHVDRVVSLEGAPSSMAADGSSLWLGDPSTDSLVQIDPGSGSRSDSIPLSAQPGGIAVAGKAVWVASTVGGTILRVDRRARKEVDEVSLGGQGSTAIASGRAGLWAADATERTLVKIDPQTGAKLKTIQLDVEPTALAVGRSLWVADYAGDTVTEVDPVLGQELSPVHVGQGPAAVAVGADGVWVANGLDGTVSRIDLRSTSVSSVTVGKGPSALTVASGSVWVASRYSGIVTRLGTKMTDVKRISVGGEPTAVAAADGRVWVGSGSSGQAHRGGTLVLLTTQQIGTSDPSDFVYAGPSQFSRLAYDTLVSFQQSDGPAGLRLVPDLALGIPEPTERGTVYAFKIRPGIRYSNGKPLRASDFRRGMERMFRLAARTDIWDGARNFLSLVGAACYQRPDWTSCNLSRAISVDDAAGTVVFRLRSADPAFRYSLATQAFAAPIPPGVPDPGCCAFGSVPPVPGTGPYRIAVQDLQHIRFERNPYFHEWSPAAQPDGYPDAIVWRLSSSPEAEVDAIRSGRADWTYDTLPPEELRALQVRFPAQVHANPWFLYQFAQLNASKRPFNDVRVRRALNYAIDRRKILRMYGGSAVAAVSCQPLVPGLTGYRRYCPYALNLPLAKRLVAASGTRGQTVDVWGTTDSTGVPRQVADYFAAVLDSLGYRAHVRRMRTDQYSVASRTALQIYVDGDAVPDYPRPSSYLPSSFACLGGSNYHYFCDPTLDKKMARAAALQQTDQRRAAALWQEIDHEIVDLALWVPYVNPLGVDFVSARVRNYHFHPVWGFLADQAWLR